MLRRVRGPVLAYVAYTAVMAAAVTGLWTIGQREYDARLDLLHHQLGDVSAKVASLVESSTGHVDLIRRQAEALLEEPAPTFGARRAFAGLAPSEFFAGYALDRLPPNSSPDQLVNLTGSGEIPPVTSSAGREMLMALSLGAVLEATHAQIPEGPGSTIPPPTTSWFWRRGCLLATSTGRKRFSATNFSRPVCRSAILAAVSTGPMFM